MSDVEAFLAQYREAWRQNSAAEIESSWDTGMAKPFYKAEEIGHIITDWEQLRAYWRHNESFNEINELSYSNIVPQAMGDERMLIGLKMRWDIRFAADARQIDGSAFAWAGQTMGGENHVACCLRQVDGDWRLTSWVEAPDAPILYMANLYMQNVRSDFPSTST